MASTDHPLTPAEWLSAIARTLADEVVLEPWPSPAAIIQHVALALYMRAGHDNTVAGLTSADLDHRDLPPRQRRDLRAEHPRAARHGLAATWS